MLRINYLAVVAATVAWFVVGSLWYSPLLFGKVWMELSGMNPAAMAQMKMPVVKVLAEFVRGFVVAYVLARFVALLGVVDWKGALQLGIWVWIGFPVMLLAGSVSWQNVPWMVAAIHAGDWLVKMLFMPVMLAVWRK